MLRIEITKRIITDYKEEFICDSVEINAKSVNIVFENGNIFKLPNKYVTKIKVVEL